MSAHGLDHVDLVVRSLDRSLPWYRELLAPLGYTRESEIEGEQGERVVYLNGSGRLGAVSLRSAVGEAEVDRYRVGSVHHVCFGAGSREQVDAAAEWLRGAGAEIESGPEEYSYTPGYYAVFFRDPDGIKLEVMHRPRVFRERLRLYDQPASANCMKARIVLRMLGAEFERVEIDIFSLEGRSPEHRARNVAGRTPVLEVDGRFLAESGAILLWLAEGTPLLPDDPWDRAQVVRWLMFEQNEVEAGIAFPRFLALTGRDQGEVAVLKPKGRQALKSLERHLASAHGEGFVCGAPSVADVALYAYVHVAEDAGHSLAEFPAVVSWIERVEALPGFENDLAPMPPHAMA